MWGLTAGADFGLVAICLMLDDLPCLLSVYHLRSRCQRHQQQRNQPSFHPYRLPKAVFADCGNVKFLFHAPRVGAGYARFVQGVVIFTSATCANPKQAPKPRGVRASQKTGQRTLKTLFPLIPLYPLRPLFLQRFAQTAC